jgi:hypothetical protein
MKRKRKRKRGGWGPKLGVHVCVEERKGFLVTQGQVCGCQPNLIKSCGGWARGGGD